MCLHGFICRRWADFFAPASLHYALPREFWPTPSFPTNPPHITNPSPESKSLATFPHRPPQDRHQRPCLRANRPFTLHVRAQHKNGPCDPERKPLAYRSTEETHPSGSQDRSSFSTRPNHPGPVPPGFRSCLMQNSHPTERRQSVCAVSRCPWEKPLPYKSTFRHGWFARFSVNGRSNRAGRMVPNL